VHLPRKTLNTNKHEKETDMTRKGEVEQNCRLYTRRLFAVD